MIPHYSKLAMMTYLRQLYNEIAQHNVFTWADYADHVLGGLNDNYLPAWHLGYYFGPLLTYEVAPEDYGCDVLFEPEGVKIGRDVYMTYGRAYG